MAAEVSCKQEEGPGWKQPLGCDSGCTAVPTDHHCSVVPLSSTGCVPATCTSIELLCRKRPAARQQPDEEGIQVTSQTIASALGATECIPLSPLQAPAGGLDREQAPSPSPAVWSWIHRPPPLQVQASSRAIPHSEAQVNWRQPTENCRIPGTVHHARGTPRAEEDPSLLPRCRSC